MKNYQKKITKLIKSEDNKETKEMLELLKGYTIANDNQLSEAIHEVAESMVSVYNNDLISWLDNYDNGGKKGIEIKETVDAVIEYENHDNLYDVITSAQYHYYYNLLSNLFL